MRWHLWQWNFYAKKFSFSLLLLSLSFSLVCDLSLSVSFSAFKFFFFPCCDYLLPCMLCRSQRAPTMNANDRLFSSVVQWCQTKHTVFVCLCVCFEITFSCYFVRVFAIFLLFLWLVMSWNTVLRLPHIQCEKHENLLGKSLAILCRRKRLLRPIVSKFESRSFVVITNIHRECVCLCDCCHSTPHIGSDARARHFEFFTIWTAANFRFEFEL